MTISGELVILGSGTSTGVPIIGCDCAVCSSAEPRNRRSRCSALIRCGEANILIDTATDLRYQALREKIRRIDAVLYTHSHADHVHGIDELRVFNLRSDGPIPIYGSAATLDGLRCNFGYIFEKPDKSGFRPKIELRPVDAPFAAAGVAFTPLILQHGDGVALGYRCGDLAYLTDCNGIPDATWKLLENLDTLIIDALRFKPHETHFTIAEAVTVAGRIGARRTVLTHLSHDIDYPLHNPRLPAGIEFAYDGQILPFCPVAA